MINPSQLQNLQEAYMQVYEQIVPDPANTRPMGTPRVNPESMKKHNEYITLPDMQKRNLIKDINWGQQVKKNTTNNLQVAHLDLLDAIKGYLLDEGYATTPESADAILDNMSDEWLDTIINQIAEGFIPWFEPRGTKPSPRDRARQRHSTFTQSGTRAGAARASQIQRVGAEMYSKLKDVALHTYGKTDPKSIKRIGTAPGTRRHTAAAQVTGGYAGNKMYYSGRGFGGIKIGDVDRPVASQTLRNLNRDAQNRLRYQPGQRYGNAGVGLAD